MMTPPSHLRSSHPLSMVSGCSRGGIGGSLGLIGLVIAGTGIYAVLETENELGSATLMVAGVYFGVASFLGRFPKLKFGDSEIDPNEVAAATQKSAKAQDESEEAKEGLKKLLERLERLEANAKGRAEDPVPEPVHELTPPTSVPEDPPTAPATQTARALDARLMRLAEEYNEVRFTMSSGNDRTVRMTGIVNQMIEVCADVEVADVEALLTSEDRGLRLVGVAFLNARPDPEFIDRLTDAAVLEDKPFNEYWALLTLRKSLRGNCPRLNANLRLKLQERMDALPRGVDRWRLIQAILDDCP